MENIIEIFALLEEEEEEELLLLKRYRSSPKNMFLQRRNEGCFETLIIRHLIDCEEKFIGYFRVSREIFNKILMAIKDDLTDTQPRTRKRKLAITVQEKLCLTLRFLATGESYRSLSFQFRISHNWICKIVPKVLQSIFIRLVSIALPEPTEEDFRRIAEEYWLLWNFPNCIGAIDGKHIRIMCPSNSGSLYFNYKQFLSIVLLAVVDANRKFITIDIGSYGKEGDAGIFMKSNLFAKIQNGQLNFPSPSKLPGGDIEMPYVFVGDDAFSLTNYMMKPYSKNYASRDRSSRIFNYRICRARRTSENAFGILCQRFRIFFSPIAVMPCVIDKLVMSACIIHNMMGSLVINGPHNNSLQMPTENVIPMARILGRNCNVNGDVTRTLFKQYFNSDHGSVPWQDNEVDRTS